MRVISIRNEALSTSVREPKFAKKSESPDQSCARKPASRTPTVSPPFAKFLLRGKRTGGGFRIALPPNSEPGLAGTRGPGFTVVICDKRIRLTAQYCGSKKVATLSVHSGLG